MTDMHQSPAEVMSFSLGLSPQSIAASSAANGNAIDIFGWDGVMFILALGAIDGTQDMKAQSDDNSGMSSPTDISGASIAQVAGTGDDTIQILDVNTRKLPAGERYVRPVVTNGAGATADFQAVITVRYRGTGRFPMTQHASLGQLVKA